jgi:arabinogalactan oligomer/maltooligosaccharide transport system substrate-binding protein
MLGSRVLTAALAAGAVAAATLSAAPASQAATTPIVIWSDAAHAPVLTKLLATGYQGTPVEIVSKDLATMQDDLGAAKAGNGPDLVWGDLAWTGPLASAGTIVPVTMAPKRAAKFRPNVRAGNQVGKDNYGIPVQISNLALVTNTKLVPKQPATFSDLAAKALRLVKNKKAKIPIALAQGNGANPYTTFPLFSGLGGYLFGQAKAGGLDPMDVGLASKALKKNAGQIDAWNKAGLLDPSLTVDAARTAFMKGRSAFWLAGPEDLPTLMKLSFVYRIGDVPPVVKGRTSSPLLTIHGFMVTRFAEKHGVAEQAAALAGKYLTKPGVQQQLAAASGWYPANTVAAGTVSTGGGRVKAIGNAGTNGVPMPNIAQAGSVWEPYGTAWSASTSGPSATPAKKAFMIAQRAAKAAIAG